MAEERIQKIMSEQGLCSRRAAEQIIAEGRVKVNGHPVKVGDKMDPTATSSMWTTSASISRRTSRCTIWLCTSPVAMSPPPVTSWAARRSWSWWPTSRPACTPVGRLDKDSEGLLLMTNDGAFAQAVTHPSGGISKLYRVTVQPRADEGHRS